MSLDINQNMIVLSVNNSIENIEGNPSFRDLRSKINAELAEIVYCDNDMALLVDEEGLIFNKPINKQASRTAGRTIVGDAVYLPLAVLENLEY